MRTPAVAFIVIGWGVAGAQTLYDEPFRLQYHFSPAATWTNDPNGLVWYKGEYHLFFQNNPFGNKWGHMSWGHAVSPDLLHWKELPVAIPEENGIMIFSGSAVVDWNNSSGLCRNKDSSDQSCLVAVYTGHTDRLQTQNVAFSNDRGRTWKKYSRNPVIDLHMKDFRDPKVFWHEPTRKWVMAVSLPNEHKVRLFAAPDLLHWSALSDFGPAGATGGQWECPDLFPLGNSWVMVVNINPGGVAGGSGAQYFIGRFDGRQFRNEHPPTTLWADYGKDFYAAVTYFNGPRGDHRKIFQGWFSNWEYANDEPTSPQRGAMAFPRELTLAKDRLTQAPIREIAGLRTEPFQAAGIGIESANERISSRNFRGNEAEIEVEFYPAGAAEFGLLIHKGASEQTIVGVKRSGVLFVDRTRSGDVKFNPKFAGVSSGPIQLKEIVSLHILVDRSSVEVFGNGGEVVLSERVFPKPTSDRVELYSTGGEARVKSLRMWKLKSTWNSR